MSESEQYEKCKKLMGAMVENSQKPDEGNLDFVEAVHAGIDGMGFATKTIKDPKYPDRALLIVEAGDPEGQQSIVALSHSDVVGVEGQSWSRSPWKLYEENHTWFGRGVCDTHGSGTAMLLAAARPEVREHLERNNKKISIIFTYDEEATSPEFSMRGAKFASGLLGQAPLIESKYFIAGEPTEYGGKIMSMRGHKGRWLAHFFVEVEHSGHVSETVQNAFMSGSSIVHEIGQYARMITLGSQNDKEAKIYQPPHSTVQVSAANIKSGDFSSTPSQARFTVDMRTLPEVHELRVKEITDLINRGPWEAGSSVKLQIVKDAKGSITNRNSPIVKIAESVTGELARGFNGGDEGRILRLQAGKEGVTVGPGELRFAHMPDERVSVKSVMNAVELYEKFFKESVKL